MLILSNAELSFTENDRSKHAHSGTDFLSSSTGSREPIFSASVSPTDFPFSHDENITFSTFIKKNNHTKSALKLLKVT